MLDIGIDSPTACRQAIGVLLAVSSGTGREKWTLLAGDVQAALIKGEFQDKDRVLHCWAPKNGPALPGVQPAHPKCKYSQFQHLTECARQHISPTTSKTHDFKTTPATNELTLCLDATLGIGGSRSIPTVHRCPQGKAVGGPIAPQLDNNTQTLT